MSVLTAIILLVIVGAVSFILGWAIGQASGYDSGREDGATGRYGP